MKKFTTIAMALMLGGFAINAQDLGEGSLMTSPYFQYELGEIDVDWNNQTIYFVDESKTYDSYEYDFDSGEMVPSKVNYTDVELQIPGQAEPLTLAAVLSAARGGETTDGKSGTILLVSFWDQPDDVKANFPDEWPYGEYTLTIPEGSVKNADEQTNADTEISIYFYTTYMDPETYLTPMTFNPAKVYGADYNLYPVSELQTVTINFGETIKQFTKAINDENEEVAITVTDLTTGSILASFTADDFEDAIDGTTLTLDLSEYVTNGLMFDVDVPDLFAICEYKNETYYNPSGSVTYYAWNGLPEAEILSQPATIGSINANPIELTWDYQAITLNEGVTVTAEVNGEEIEIPASNVVLFYAPQDNDQTPGVGPDDTPVAQADENNALRINLIGLFNDYAGSSITVTVPEGLVSANGKDNTSQSFTFSVYDIYDGEAVLTEVKDSEGIYTLVWDGISQVNNNYYAEEDGLVIQLEDEASDIISDILQGYEGDDSVGTYYTVMDWDTNESSLYFNLNYTDLEDGVYYLMVPEAYFMLIDNENVEFINGPLALSLTVENGVMTGINGIEAAPSVFNGVYNLQGVKVSSDINSLPNGLYIIDGKKVFIRK